MAYNHKRLSVNAGGLTGAGIWIYYNGSGAVASGRDGLTQIKDAGFFGDTRETVLVGPSGKTVGNPGGASTLMEGRTQVVSLIEDLERAEIYPAAPAALNLGTPPPTNASWLAHARSGQVGRVTGATGGGLPALIHGYDGLEWVLLVLAPVSGQTYRRVQRQTPAASWELT